MSDLQNKISGEKIYCEGHRIEKPSQKVQADGHHGFCTIVRHGFCIVRKEARWKRKDET